MSTETEPLRFTFAPRLTHARVDGLTPGQQREALHEFVELLGCVKRHVFNPGKSTHTRVLAIATILDQSEKAAARHKDLSEPLPFWAGRPDQEGSFAARVGLGQNFISSEMREYERAGLIARPHRRSENGNDHTDLAVYAPLLDAPELLPDRGQRPRREPVRCPSCQSDVLIREQRTRITCACCGAVCAEESHRSFVNGEPAENAENQEDIVTREVTIEASSIVTREVTIEASSAPPIAVSSVDEAIAHNVGFLASDFEEEEPPADRSPADVFEAAAHLLVAMAGDEPQHIAMAGDPARKYQPVSHPFGLEDARAHQRGETRGARLRRADGQTRALCFDGDTGEVWQHLRDAAHLLYAAGYTVLLEESPAGRGGHLWIIYTDLVNARAAFRHVREIAPQLATIKECWPEKKQSVRLPGGAYITPEWREQCKLYDAIGALLASTRREAAAALLECQTPASLVPDYPPEPEPEPQKPANTKATEMIASLAEYQVSFSPRELVNWFNSTHPLESIHPLETSTHARATWRGEQGRPSVSYLENGRWFDHGNAAQKSGDALDLYCLVHGKDKTAFLREMGGEYRASLLSLPQEQEEQARGDIPAPAIANEASETQGGATCFKSLDEQIAALIQERNLTPAAPCEKCGCPLHTHLDLCARCWPARGYHEYAHLIDAHYPRRRDYAA